MRHSNPAWHRCIFAFLTFQAAFPAFADPVETPSDDIINPDRPGIADGSTVVGVGHFQIEAGVQLEYRDHRSDRDHRLFVPVLLRLGFDRSWELRIEGNGYTRETLRTVQDSTTFDGMAPTSIGLKYQFIESLGAARPSAGAILRVFPETGTGAFRTSHTTGDFRFAADWDFAPKFSLNPNLGVGLYEDDVGRPYSTALFATTLNYNPTKVFNLFVDTGIQSSEAKHGRALIIIDIGTAYVISRAVQFDLSVGSKVLGVTSPHPFLSAGVSKRF